MYATAVEHPYAITTVFDKSMAQWMGLGVLCEVERWTRKQRQMNWRGFVVDKDVVLERREWKDSMESSNQAVGIGHSPFRNPTNTMQYGLKYTIAMPMSVWVEWQYYLTLFPLPCPNSLSFLPHHMHRMHISLHPKAIQNGNETMG